MQAALVLSGLRFVTLSTLCVSEPNCLALLSLGNNIHSHSSEKNRTFHDLLNIRRLAVQ